MKKRRIPKTDLDVSCICLGTMTFGTPVCESDAINLVHYAFDKGINFIDTANMYEGYTRYIGSSGGVAEEIVGKAISGRRRDFVVATKLGMKVGDTPEDEGTSPSAIRKHLKLSLRRMNTNFIDIYYLHKPDPITPLADTLGAIDKVMREGKIRYYGISNYSAEQTSELLKVADANRLPRPVVIQPGMSLLKQEVVTDLLPLCKKEEIGVVPYQVLQAGLLTGKYKRGKPIPADSRKVEKSAWVWELTDELFDKLEAIETEAQKARLTMSQYAIRWALQQPAVVSAVIGVRRVSQIDEALLSAERI